MFPAALSERLDALIDELILNGGVEAASLASILLTAKDSISRDDHMSLSQKVWTANDELLTAFARNHEHGRAASALHPGPTGCRCATG